MKTGLPTNILALCLLFLNGVWAGWWGRRGGCSTNWGGWTPCSQSCGGGTRSRYSSCGSKRDYQVCNRQCYNGEYHGGSCFCLSESFGSCCESCPIINHCASGQRECTSTHHSRCKRCLNGYYTIGWTSNLTGCLACTPIQNCIDVRCTSNMDSRCFECVDDRVFYKKTHSDTQCERKCAWNHHYCWPGQCADELTRECSCAAGFHKVADSGGTKCQLNIKPSLEICDMTMVGPRGKKVTSDPDKCQDKNDFFGNVLPTSALYRLTAAFTIDSSKFPTKPDFIQETNFGITDTAVSVIHKRLSGEPYVVTNKHLRTDTSNSTNATETDFQSGNIQLSVKLNDGDRLCVRFHAQGGGYLQTKDMTNRKVANPEPFEKTECSRDLCYWYDNTPPQHCSETGACLMQPIALSTRITRTETVDIEFAGWLDPVPHGGNTSHASKIELFDLQVNEMSGRKLLHTGSRVAHLSKELSANTHAITLNLSSSHTKLYCIKLGVKDIADNVRFARRFVLYDNTSTITANDNYPFYVSSATNQSKHTWQTNHGKICLEWKDHFINKDYFDNDFLSPIESELEPPYEQTTGILPISGTTSVNGILGFAFTWSDPKKPELSQTEAVPDFINQSFCKTLSMYDGAAYNLTIEAKDIVNNTLKETRSVFIDRSVPVINNIWLVKNKKHALFVHDSKDLSKMSLEFEAYDVHSGIKQVTWAFATSDFGSNLEQKSETILTVSAENCSAADGCYCPVIGKCEKKRYTLSLNSLIANDVSKGNHNRNYYFTIRVTNHALLSNTEHIDILVDDSPPTVGSVYEGSEDGFDIDYTSDNSYMVHWHGFFDHESGINLYRIAVDDHCLNKDTLLNVSSIDGYWAEIDGSLTSIRVPANFTGTRYVSVLAFNNAMAPSKAACSDGITKDSTVPVLGNISLENAKWTEKVVCYKNQPWMLKYNLKGIPLPNVTSCIALCDNYNDNIKLVQSLPIELPSKQDEDFSNFLCENLKMYTVDTVIFLPNDHIFLQWDVEDDMSQIQDFHVGFGSDSGDSISPSILKYESTRKRQFFKLRHTGIATDTLFYIHIKAINKASLESIITVGPLLTDETPPLYKNIPEVTVNGQYVVLGWENDTFFDTEQTEPVSRIVFQFFSSGPKKIAVSPLLEWRFEASWSCANVTGGCIKYPVQKLQQVNKGVMFYTYLMVYNHAGHYLELESKSFLIPSRIPPGQSILRDLDPTDENWTDTDDIDAHFSINIICLGWSGFRYELFAKLQVAVGTSKYTEDVLPYRYTNATKHLCISSKAIPTYTKLFVMLKATYSGRSTISTSDGVRIYNISSVTDSLNVFDGTGCPESTSFVNISLKMTNNFTIVTVRETLVLGHIYSLYLTEDVKDLISIKSSSIIIRTERKSGMKHVYEFWPLTNKPSITLKGQVNQTGSIRILKCSLSSSAQTQDSQLDAYWDYDDMYKLTHFRLETAVFHNTCENTINISCLRFITPFRNSASHNTSTINGLSLSSGQIYGTAVRLCLNNKCSHFKVSPGLVIDPVIPKGEIQQCQLDLTDAKGVKLLLSWHAFETASHIIFYQWCLSSDTNGIHLISAWRTLPKTSELSGIYSVAENIDLDHPYRRIYGCVRAFSLSGNVGVVCRKIYVHSNATYNTDTVYDIDTSKDSWYTILKILHSSYLGENVSILHDAELDFGTTLTSVGAVVLYGTERNITWHLMTSPECPLTCHANPHCIISKLTRTGFVKFDTITFLYNKPYYICAFSRATVIKRELFVENLNELKACSNGFIIDSKPPCPGNIHIENLRGYLSSTNYIRVTWDRFTGDPFAESLGYPESVQSYSVGVGTKPGSDDVLNFSPVGLSTAWSIPQVTAKNGEVIFVSIKGISHSGLSTTVSSEGLIIDRTAPASGSVMLDFSRKQFPVVNSGIIRTRFQDFLDQESGVDYFEAGIGSTSDRADILPFRNYFSDQAELDTSSILDGHTYYVNVHAVNRAGLRSDRVSKMFKVDRSVPLSGRVLDGSSKADEDYSTDTTKLRGHWQDFVDPHSGISYFEVGVGNQPFRDNVEPMIQIGLKEEYTWSKSFTAGEKYYILVRACNGAGLCVKESSNGIILDNSPPIRGIVRVGNENRYSKFLSQRSSLQFHWIGFADPQSGILTFDACIGTGIYACDVEPLFHCFLSSSFIKYNLNLPEGQDLFVTVTAYNKAKINVSQSSDSFQIDSSPPVETVKPVFLTEYNKVHGYSAQWEKSVLRATWAFEDTGSPVIRHLITLSTHHEGHTPLEHLELGPENKLTINFDNETWLHDGDKYKLIVTACNAAGLCSVSETDDLMIDSTPPHNGGFAIPMSWNNIEDETNKTRANVSVTWIGFADQESGIKSYIVTLSRSYSGSELFSGKFTQAKDQSETEAVVANLVLSESLTPGDKIIAALWAKNNAGLQSPVIRLTLTAVSSMHTSDKLFQRGSLEIEKHSCELHYCTKECTCAVVGLSCVDADSNMTCKEVNSSVSSVHAYPYLSVYGGLQRYAYDKTASSACLAGHWNFTMADSFKFKRFEWSMGIEGGPIGAMIFDINTERVWHDIGRRTEVVHCLPPGRDLLHEENYYIYVRAWYRPNEYSLFSSPPILVDQTPPKILKGRFIKDSDVSCHSDYDVISWTENITACWEGVFSDSQSHVMFFVVGLGTSPQTDDVVSFKNNGLVTKLQLTKLTLSHGTQYYFTVSAYNGVGLHTTLSSDGFKIDTEPPSCGIVFNTNRHRNAAYQSSADSFDISWHGFIDHFSGIRNYHVSLLEAYSNESLVDFINVGLMTNYKFPSLNLESGKSYVGLVRAEDAAGHFGEITQSYPKLIDPTPPQQFKCYNKTQVSAQSTVTTSITFKHKLMKDRMYIISGSIGRQSLQIPVYLQIGSRQLFLPAALNHDETRSFEYNFLSSKTGFENIRVLFGDSKAIKTFVYLEECTISVSENLNGSLHVRQIGPHLLAVNVMLIDTESALYKVEVGIGTTKGSFQVQPLTPIYGNNGIVEIDLAHGSNIYVTAVAENNAGLRSVVKSDSIKLDHTPPALGVIQSNLEYNSTEMTSNSNGQTMAVTVKTTWSAEDPESGIKLCLCSVGTQRYPTSSTIYKQIDNYVCHETLSGVAHGTNIFTHIKCINNIELAALGVSSPLTASYDSPDVTKARIEFIPVDIYSHHGFAQTRQDNTTVPDFFVQSNLANLSLRWSGFKDISGLDKYEYRLVRGNATVIDWNVASKRTFVTVEGLELADGELYTAEVRAINRGNVCSESVSAHLIAIDKGPKLSGQSIKISSVERNIHLDWREVFEINLAIRAAYTLTVGTQRGYNDIVDIPFLKSQTYQFVVPGNTMEVLAVQEVYISIQCMYETGLSSRIDTVFVL